MRKSSKSEAELATVNGVATAPAKKGSKSSKGESKGSKPASTPTKKGAEKASKGSKGESKASKPEAIAPAKKAGLRKPQVRILAFLAEVDRAANYKEISYQADADACCSTSLLGSPDEAVRVLNDERYFPCLLSTGFIRYAKPNELPDVEGGTGRSAAHFIITASGKKEVRRIGRAALLAAGVPASRIPADAKA